MGIESGGRGVRGRGGVGALARLAVNVRITQSDNGRWRWVAIDAADNEIAGRAGRGFDTAIEAENQMFAEAAQPWEVTAIERIALDD